MNKISYADSDSCATQGTDVLVPSVRGQTHAAA